MTTPEVLINRNTRQMDDADIAALIDVIHDLGHEAALDRSERVHASQGHGWMLMLRWVGDHPADVAEVGTFLVLLAGKVGALFKNRGKEPPHSIPLYGPDNRVIARVEVPDDEERRT